MKIISLNTSLGEGVTAEPETYERTGTIRDEEEAYYSTIVPSPPRRPTELLRLRAQPNPQPRYGRVRTCRPYTFPNFLSPPLLIWDVVRGHSDK